MQQQHVFAGGDIPRNMRRESLAKAIQAAGRPLLFGLRLWASVCLALYVAFYLELDNPFWAGTSAAIVCQPVLGASLRKGWFRMVGTVIGAIAIVVLSACFPQSRAGFLVGLALWGAACGMVATLLRDFASYAAALAGFTAAIIAGDELGLVGGTNGQAFILAVVRATETCIGIVCAGVILASTDLGHARQQLATLLATLSAEITGGLLGSLRLAGSEQGRSRPVRRELIHRVSGLDTIIDQARGETAALRFHPRTLRGAVDGLFAALSSWRAIATHLERKVSAPGDSETAAVLSCLPDELRRAVATEGDAKVWAADPFRIRRDCLMAARSLASLASLTPSLRLLADHTAAGLLGICRALTGVIVVIDPHRPDRGPRVARLHVPDLLPVLITSLRVFVTIGAAALIWIVTAWPGGASMMTFAAITVILFSPREDAAYETAKGFMLGTAIAAVLAAIVGFAVLPQQPTFAGFCIAIGLVLVPAGALFQSWQAPMFFAMAALFIPLLGPTNPMNYDTVRFYNSALAIVTGVGLAVLGLRLIPPLPPALRTRRLVALTLRDLRRLITGPLPTPASITEWQSRVYGRLSVMPEQADLLQSARLVAALTVGTEVTRLRRAASRFLTHTNLDAALDAVARGNSTEAIRHLYQFDDVLAAIPATTAGRLVSLRARATICAIVEVLTQHASYFDEEDPA